MSADAHLRKALALQPPDPPPLVNRSRLYRCTADSSGGSVAAWRFQVVELGDYGRRKVGPVGPAFADPKQAAAFCRDLNGGGPADAVSAAEILSSVAASESLPAIAADEPPAEPEVAGPPICGTVQRAPEELSQLPALANDMAGPSVTPLRPSVVRQAACCEGCGALLAPSRQHRRTCSPRCRQAAHRRQRAAVGALQLEVFPGGPAAGDVADVAAEGS